MNLKRMAAAAAATVALMGAGGAAHAAFEGRIADGTPSTTCTASGQNKCLFFYDTVLDITILNSWQQTPWAPFASTSGATAHDLAAAAGASASSGVASPLFATGWVLPTGDGNQAAGPLNQIKSIVQRAGGSAGMWAQFAIPVDTNPYFWSSSQDLNDPGKAWVFRAASGSQFTWGTGVQFGAVAVHVGDVAAGMASSVPEPQTCAMMVLGLATLLVAAKRRAR